MLPVSQSKRQRERQKAGKAYIVGACPSGKRCHDSRASAKTHAVPLRRGHLRPYWCDQCCYWHVGHIPGAVLHGLRTATEHYEQRPLTGSAPLPLT